MLEVSHVTKVFGDTPALSDISFEVKDREFVFLTGPSGAGKTTLLRLILGEITPDAGKIILDGSDVVSLSTKEVPLLRQKIGVIFQDYKLLPERTARENIEVALAILGVPQSEWQDRVDHVLKLVGLAERPEFFPSQLSGGELQRVSIARALVINPKIILADEPTGNLDWKTGEEIMDLFDRINKEGKTVIVASHHKALIEKMGKRVIELNGGKINGATKEPKPKKEGK